MLKGGMGSIIMVCFFIGDLGAAQNPDLDDFCHRQYLQTAKCPASICQLKQIGEESTQQEKPAVCIARPCTEIPPEACPLEFCAVMVDCSKQKICHFKMPGEPAVCGDLAYAGQDVDCCAGLVRRCGIEFMDGTCDMEGRNSVYNLPICIPCGDGICGNFENRCNCPEDCGVPPKHGGSQRDLPFVYIKDSKDPK